MLGKIGALPKELGAQAERSMRSANPRPNRRMAARAEIWPFGMARRIASRGEVVSRGEAQDPHLVAG